MICVECPKTANHSQAILYLVKEEMEIKLTNVLPVLERSISKAESNIIIKEFCNKYIEEASKQTGASVSCVGGEQSMDKRIGKNATKLLKSFSDLANKSSGATHPCDRERWVEFIFYAYQNRNEIGVEMLADWLQNDGWDEETSFTLAFEYSFAREILEEYDKYRRKQ